MRYTILLFVYIDNKLSSQFECIGPSGSALMVHVYILGAGLLGAIPSFSSSFLPEAIAHVGSLFHPPMTGTPSSPLAPSSYAAYHRTTVIVLLPSSLLLHHQSLPTAASSADHETLVLGSACYGSYPRGCESPSRRIPVPVPTGLVH